MAKCPVSSINDYPTYLNRSLASARYIRACTGGVPPQSSVCLPDMWQALPITPQATVWGLPRVWALRRYGVPCAVDGRQVSTTVRFRGLKAVQGRCVLWVPVGGGCLQSGCLKTACRCGVPGFVVHRGISGIVRNREGWIQLARIVWVTKRHTLRVAGCKRRCVRQMATRLRSLPPDGRHPRRCR